MHIHISCRGPSSRIERLRVGKGGTQQHKEEEGVKRLTGGSESVTFVCTLLLALLLSLPLTPSLRGKGCGVDSCSTLSPLSFRRPVPASSPPPPPLQTSRMPPPQCLPSPKYSPQPPPVPVSPLPSPPLPTPPGLSLKSKSLLFFSIP